MIIKRVLILHHQSIFLPTVHITAVRNIQTLIAKLKQEPFDVAIVDDLEIFKQIQSCYPKFPVAIVTPLGSIEQAVESIKQGAIDYISKPLSSEVLEQLIHRLEIKDTHSTIDFNILAENQDLFLPSSPCMQRIIADIFQVSTSNATVFIYGESGTGKEVVAHMIHHRSSRQFQPFIKVNCAAIAESLIESEFFGHEKGAFTGAGEKRLGRFELAHKGTLLLDEISEISLPLQAKLLRVIQEKTFERVGGTKPIKVDVRLIATSNRDMKLMVEQKLFREDLYFRLNVVPIQLPPLRERKEDILPLAEYFLKKFCKQNGKSNKFFTKEAQQILLDYPWPGNIRELSNIIERSVIMNLNDRIDPKDLRLDPSSPSLLTTCVPELLPLAEIEKRHILEMLSLNQYNRSKTAQALGISVRTLRNKLKDFK